MNTYTITLSEQQLAVIDQALQSAPFKMAAPLFEHINQQIKAAEAAVLTQVAAE